MSIWFFSLNSSKGAGDSSSIDEVISNIDQEYQSRVKVIEYSGNLNNLLRHFQSVDSMITCKYHSIIFSFIFVKPMIVLLYHPKCLSLHEDLGLPEESRVSISQIMNDMLVHSIEELHANPNRFLAPLSLETARTRAMYGIRRCFKSCLEK